MPKKTKPTWAMQVLREPNSKIFELSVVRSDDWTIAKDCRTWGWSSRTKLILFDSDSNGLDYTDAKERKFMRKIAATVCTMLNKEGL